MVIILLGIGTYLTLRLGFVQVTRLRHGAAVASGKYDDPDDEGDVTHFQALTTALSATVGIGNIAGVALAIHWGGPGALFWMWVTAALGMATKYSEVTLAQKYRVHEHEGEWAGTVSGGPMYYIERGLGPNWKWMAILFAVLLGFTAFLTGNGGSGEYGRRQPGDAVQHSHLGQRPGDFGGRRRGDPGRNHPHRQGDRRAGSPDGRDLRARRADRDLHERRARWGRPSR